ncbi:amidohydrolase family protein [Ruegeria sp. 2012CJ41-6]|uniref:Amidohydrolase family protein n=1 Tax=Ruegeria spongiae TaxID=2942209 RepID=A0ABT0Q2X2_9RHOB|nr:amidohydrolase family protein [Ruegeria spongiae]MCL6284219.1 amidohydrolase family protein [Ruegeria spongiae]
MLTLLTNAEVYAPDPLGPDSILIAGKKIAYLRFREAGCQADRFTISSDGGGCLPAFDREGRLTRFGVGVPLDEALAPLTHNVADLLKLHHKGRLAVGMDADLVILDGDLDVRDVMARGNWHLRDHQTVRRGMYEATA